MEKKKNTKSVTVAEKVAPTKKVTVRIASPKMVERKPAERILTAEGWQRRKMKEHLEKR